MGIKNVLEKLEKIIKVLGKSERYYEEQKLLTARMLQNSVIENGNISSLNDAEYKVFSQWGDDGIIQWLTHHINIPEKTFIEFGVEDYRESNTRFLLMNNYWSGGIIDGSEKNMAKVKNSEYFWRHDLQAQAAFITRENINELLSAFNFNVNIGLLHVDIDGNDYWVWEEISVVKPVIFIAEYNAVFGAERAISVPYKKDFYRTSEHYSNLYFGASLKALIHLSNKKGYTFVGCTKAGNNAYFVKNEYMTEQLNTLAKNACFVESKFREGRNQDGSLSYKRGAERYNEIKGLPVVNVLTGKTEEL